MLKSQASSGGTRHDTRRAKPRGAWQHRVIQHGVIRLRLLKTSSGNGIMVVLLISWYDLLLILSGWWYTYPSEKYEFVSWDYYSQYMEK